MPAELARAQFMDGLCQRYHCLPSAILREDVGILRMLELLRMGGPEAGTEPARAPAPAADPRMLELADLVTRG